MKPASEIVTAAERVLSRSFGDSIRLSGWERIGGNRFQVLRCKCLEGPAGTPGSFVIKRSQVQAGERYELDASKGPAWRLFNEWAGCEFLGWLEDGEDLPCPCFYGGDDVEGLIVQEDLGVHPSLHQVMSGDDPASAEETMVAVYSQLGRIHSRASTHESRYRQFRGELGPSNTTCFTINNMRRRIADSCEICARHVGLSPSAGALSELQDAISTFYDPGVFDTLIHGDPHPRNNVLVDAKVKIVDFEMSCWGNALIDIGFVFTSFPTSSKIGRLPDGVVDRVMDSYRAELARGFPWAAEDRIYHQHLVDAGLIGAIGMLAWVLPRLLSEDWLDGKITKRQRVLFHLGQAVKLCERFGRRQELADLISINLKRLRERWGGELEELDYFPAFARIQGKQECEQ